MMREPSLTRTRTWSEEDVQGGAEKREEGRGCSQQVGAGPCWEGVVAGACQTNISCFSFPV